MHVIYYLHHIVTIRTKMGKRKKRKTVKNKKYHRLLLSLFMVNFNIVSALFGQRK